MYVCMYVCIYMHTCIPAPRSLCNSKTINAHSCMYLCTRIHMHTCSNLLSLIQGHVPRMYACMYTYIHCLYVCMYVYTYALLSLSEDHVTVYVYMYIHSYACTYMHACRYKHA